MDKLPKCPSCNEDYTYELNGQLACPMCGFEWENTTTIEGFIVKDCNGKILQDGDTVTVIKDLKVKGSSNSIKVGTKVKNIRIVDKDHNIDCKIDGFGAMSLKSEFVKKVE